MHRLPSLLPHNPRSIGCMHAYPVIPRRLTLIMNLTRPTPPVHVGKLCSPCTNTVHDVQLLVSYKCITCITRRTMVVKSRLSCWCLSHGLNTSYLPYKLRTDYVIACGVVSPTVDIHLDHNVQLLSGRHTFLSAHYIYTLHTLPIRTFLIGLSTNGGMCYYTSYLRIYRQWSALTRIVSR